MQAPESPDTNSIHTHFSRPRTCAHFLSDALATGQADEIAGALHEIRRAMLDEPVRKVCDFEMNLSDVLRILDDAKLRLVAVHAPQM